MGHVEVLERRGLNLCCVPNACLLHVAHFGRYPRRALMRSVGGRLGSVCVFFFFFLALCDNCHVSQSESVSMVTLDETAALFLHSRLKTGPKYMNMQKINK